MECTKIILSSYSNVERVVKEIDNCIEKRCFNSYYDNRPVDSIFSEIADMIERKNKLTDLKKKVDLVFSLLSEEEIDLLNCKYFGKKPKNPFLFSMRTYFRKQKRLLIKLDEYFSFIGINDEKFFSDFKGDRFIALAKIRSDDIKRLSHSFFSDCKIDDEKEYDSDKREEKTTAHIGIADNDFRGREAV